MANFLATLSNTDPADAIAFAAFCGLLLSALAAHSLTTGAAKPASTSANNLDAQINLLDRLLPQTQCGQCGHLGCRPYAKAILLGAPTNLCPPGGEITARRLAQAVDDFPAPLNPSHMPPLSSSVARIREDECIGCTKCIQACPTDAIFGAAKRMHSIIESECNGCDLCVEPCPVDCIDLVTRNDERYNTQRRAGGRP